MLNVRAIHELPLPGQLNMELYLIIISIAYLSVVSFGYWLDYLNLDYMKRYGSVIPPEFEGYIDQSLLSRTRDYNIEHTKFGFIHSIFNNIVFLLFIFVLLNIYNSWTVSLNLSFILSGLVFFILLTYFETLISIPFSLYSTFKIENKYGFNTMTFKLWITDTIKSLLISTILMGLVIVYRTSYNPENPRFMVVLGVVLFSCVRHLHDVYFAICNRASFSQVYTH